MIHTELTFRSNLSASEAEARLRQVVGGEIPLLMNPTSHHPTQAFRGHVGSGHFEIRIATFYGNSFAAVYRGAILPEPDGSTVRAVLEMPTATVLISMVWSLAAISLGIDAVLKRDWVGIVSALAMITFGSGLLGLGRLLARSEAEAIARHLRTTLAAEEYSHEDT